MLAKLYQRHIRHISPQFKTLSHFLTAIDEHVSDGPRKRRKHFGQLKRTAEKEMFKSLTQRDI